MKTGRIWRLIRWLALTALLALAGTTIKLWIDRANADAAIREEMARLDKIDPGWRFEDIEAQQRKLADEDNGALAVLEVFKEIPEDWSLWEKLWEKREPQRKYNPFFKETPEEAEKAHDWDLLSNEIWHGDPGLTLTPAATQLLQSELQRVAKALAMAGNLVKYRDGCYPIAYDLVWPKTSVADLWYARSVARLLLYQNLDFSLKGQAEEGCQAALRAVHVARSFGEHPTLVSQSLRGQIVSQAVEAVERALTFGVAKKETLDRLQEWFEKEDEQTANLFLHAARLERAMTHRMMQAIWDGKLSLKDKDLDSARWGPYSWMDRIWFIGPTTLRRQHAAFLAETTDEIEKWKKPWDPKEIPVVRGTPMRIESLNDPWYKQFVNGPKVKHAQVRTQTLMRCAAVAMAVERFRLDRGSWTKSLQDLRPIYIKEVPDDPYGNGPIRMVRKEDGVVIYSVWKDGQDNGGVLDRANVLQEGTDYGIQLCDTQDRKIQALRN